MITQKVDKEDSILGFVHTWIDRLARKLDGLDVIAGFIGKTNLPDNVKLYSLGKERAFNKFYRITNFIKYLIKLISSKKNDLIFVHMCPEFAIFAAPYARLKKIPIVMWYTHKDTNLGLRIAHLLVDQVVTSSKDGFRLKSNKVIVTGHGIDAEKFKVQSSKFKVDKTKKIILSVGRISPIKDYETLIQAADILINGEREKDLQFIIVGETSLNSQKGYYANLQKLVKDLRLEPYVRFVGSAAYAEVHNYYQKCYLFVTASHAGCLEKAALEAMACAKPILVCNEAFKDVLDIYSEQLMFEKRNVAELAEKINSVLQMGEKLLQQLGQNLRNSVVKKHNLDRLTGKLVKTFQSLKK